MNSPRQARRGRGRRKKEAVAHPLTNTQLACLGLYLFHEAGINPQSHQVRKFMYLQKHGAMVEWGSTWYHGYFERENYPYSDGSPNVGTLYTYTEKGRKWRLTPAGLNVARTALGMLQDYSTPTVPSGLCNFNLENGMI